MTDERGRLRPRIRDEDFNYLDYQVRCWQDNLPTELRPERIAKHNPGPSVVLESSLDRGTHFLRYILYLRANQFKIVILRPLLFSPSTVRANIKRVNALTHIANDTIETITDMNANYDLYRKQQPILNVFLSSALSTLSLVYIHGLKTKTSGTDELLHCSAMARQGIDRGLCIIRAYSQSRSSQRLLKKFAGQHGLLSRLGFTTEKTTGAEMTTSSSTWRLLHNESSSIPWPPGPLAGYPSLDGFGAFNHNFLQPGVALDEYSPLPIVGMSPFLVSSDGNFLYDDVW